MQSKFKEMKFFIRKKRGVFAFLVVGTIFLSLTASVQGSEISFEVKKDSWVSSSPFNKDDNYGTRSSLNVFKDSVKTDETYLYFEFETPQSYQTAEIYLSIVLVNEDLNNRIGGVPAQVHLIETYWEEYGITWSNKPDKGALIDELFLEKECDQCSKYIDVEDYIADGKISVCLSIPSGYEGAFGLYSREADVNHDYICAIIFDRGISDSADSGSNNTIPSFPLRDLFLIAGVAVVSTMIQMRLKAKKG